MNGNQPMNVWLQAMFRISHTFLPGWLDQHQLIQIQFGLHTLLKLLSCCVEKVFLFVTVDNTLRTSCPAIIMVQAGCCANTLRLHDADLGGAALAISSSVPQGRQGRLHEQHSGLPAPHVLQQHHARLPLGQGRRTMPFQQVPHHCRSLLGGSGWQACLLVGCAAMTPLRPHASMMQEEGGPLHPGTRRACCLQQLLPHAYWS